MPLLLLTGFPCSGKTTISHRLVDEFKERGVESTFVTDSSVNSQFNKSADFYLDKRKNMDHFSYLRSEVSRFLLSNNKQFVIVDSLNYARSQRYELFTIAKNNRTTFAILFCDVDIEISDWLNNQHGDDKYELNVIEDLRARFERPKSHLKGDKPVFELTISHPNDSTNDEIATPRNVTLPIDDLHDILITGKPMKENQATKPTSKLSSNFLYEVDGNTQKIVKHIVENQHNVGLGGTLTLPWNIEVKFTIKQFHTLISLNRLRGRFMDMAKSGLLTSDSSADQRFVEFLNTCDPT